MSQLAMSGTKMSRSYFKDENYLFNPSQTYQSNMLGSTKISKNFNQMYSSAMSPLSPKTNTNILSSFSFRERSGQLRWKEIMKIDIDFLIRCNDLSPMEQFLENMIYSSIDEDDLQAVPEANCAKLIKMFQYVVEYLLYTQQKLEQENTKIQEQCSQAMNDAEIKERTLIEKKNLIKSLMKDQKEKELVISTFKTVLDNQKSLRIEDKNVEENHNEKKETQRFYCHYCSGKKFSTEQYLEDHMRRRHLLQSEKKEQEKEPESSKIHQFEKKLEEMKSYFENYLKTVQSEGYVKLFENQKNLENKVMKIKNEKSLQFDMEKNFRSTLMEMKEFYMRNSVNPAMSGYGYQTYQPFGSTMIQSYPRENAETTNILKDQIQKMNESLFEVNKDNSLKIQSILDQMNQFRKNVADELTQIKTEKEKPETEKEEKKEKTEKKEKKEKIKPKENKIIKETIISHENDMEIKAKKRQNILKQSSQPKIFKAGPLESDHDELEEDKIVLKSTLRESSMRNMNDSLNRNDSQHFSFGHSLKASVEVQAPFARAALNNSNEKIVDIIESKEPTIEKKPDTTRFESKPVIKTEGEEEKARRDLDQFYQKFLTRDNSLVGNVAAIKDYLIPTIPEPYLQIKEKTQSKLKKRLDDSMEKLARFDPKRKIIPPAFDSCEKSSREDLISLIENAIANVDQAMSNKTWFEEYFNCVYEDVGVDIAENDFKAMKANNNTSHSKSSASSKKKVESAEKKQGKGDKKGGRGEATQIQTISDEVSITMGEEEFNQVNK